MKKKFSILMILMVLCATLAGCGSNGGTDEAKTHKITDMSGTEVTLPVEIDSVVDTWSAATDEMFNLGAADLLVSAHPAAVSDVSLMVDPGLADLKDYSQATPEEMLKLDPDLVICADDDLAQEYRDAGLNAVNLVYMSYKDFKKSTLILGDILGGEYQEKAEKLGEYIDWVQTTLKDDLKNVKDKPVVHYIMANDTSDLYSSCGAGSIMEEWINLAGGTLATKDLGEGMGLRDVTPEQILSTNPDVIMIDGDNAAEVRDALYASPEWSDITAVKEQKIYCIPKGCFWWGRLCGDTPLQALWAASILHPEDVSFDVKEETKKYYSDFKNVELTDEQLDTILRTELNK